MSTNISRRSFFAISAVAALSARGLEVAAAQEYSTPSDLTTKDVYTFLVLGLDTRPDESELNTDVIMLSRVDLAQTAVRTISIPRDLYVDIPGYGSNKINQAFNSAAANGRDEWSLGKEATVNTIEQSFGVAIDGTLSVRFEGVEKIVDAFGGVSFDNPYYLRDDIFGLNPDGTAILEYDAGVHHINGEEALRLMRSRNQDGDEGRVMRQQLILTELLREATDPRNITQLPELAEALKDTVITDIPPAVQLQLITSVPSFTTDDLVWGSLAPLLWGGTLSNGMWVYQGDWTQLPGYVQAFLNGEI